MHRQDTLVQAVVNNDVVLQFYGEWKTRRGGYRFQRLDEAGRQCGLNVPDAHRARPDAARARAVLAFIAGSQA